MTPTNLIGVIAFIAAVVVAWTKVPTKEDVVKMTKEATTAAVKAVEVERRIDSEKINSRIDRLEERYVKSIEAVDKLTGRVDNMLIMLAGSSAEEFQRSQNARQAAKLVRKNIESGKPPLQGLELDP